MCLWVKKQKRKDRGSVDVECSMDVNHEDLYCWKAEHVNCSMTSLTSYEVVVLLSGVRWNLIKSGIDTQMDSKALPSSSLKTAKSPHNSTGPGSGGSDTDGVTLREWLKSRHCKGSKTDHLSIFRKIVDLVDGSHSEGVAMHNLYPSHIKLLPSNQVMYLGLPTQKQTLDSIANSEVLQLENSFIRKRLSEKVISASLNLRSKKQKFNENARVAGDWSQCPPRTDLNLQIANDIKVNAVGSQDYCNEYKEDIQFSKHNMRSMSRIPHIFNAGQLQLNSLNERLEDKWYSSPEGGCTTSSNIYCLGVLLFEVHSVVDGCHLYYIYSMFTCSVILLTSQN